LLAPKPADAIVLRETFEPGEDAGIPMCGPHVFHRHLDFIDYPHHLRYAA
jgi:hypothetical protein